MIIESEKVAEKIKSLIDDKQSKHLKRFISVYTTSKRYRQGFERAITVFNIETNLVFAYVCGAYYGFIANNEDEVLERLNQIKARVIPPQKVLAKSLAIRVKRINDEAYKLNKNYEIYKLDNPQGCYPEVIGIKLGHSVDEFRQNLLLRVVQLKDNWMWKSEIRDINRLIKIDKINEDGFQQAYGLLITNEVLTE